MLEIFWFIGLSSRRTTFMQSTKSPKKAPAKYQFSLKLMKIVKHCYDRIKVIGAYKKASTVIPPSRNLVRLLI